MFLACRSEDKANPVIEEIRRITGKPNSAEFLPLELGCLESVRRCAELFLNKNIPLNVLILNAGLAGQKGSTSSGFELAFGICHVGHFLLTDLLLERIKDSAPARIVVVSSKAHRHCKGIDFQAVRRRTTTRTGMREYSVAKLSNILFAKELDRRLAGTGVTTYALHPGVVASDVWRSIPLPMRAILKRFMISPREGAATSIYCATDPTLIRESGRYYEKCREANSSLLSDDVLLARRLWEASENWVRRDEL